MMIDIPNPMEGNSASHVSYTGLPGPAHTVVINPNNNQPGALRSAIRRQLRSDTDTNTNGNSHTYCYRYTYRNSDATGYSNAQTSPNAGAATVVPRIGAIGGARALCSRHPACCWMHFPVCGECFHALPKPAMGITKQHESSLRTDF